MTHLLDIITLWANIENFTTQKFIINVPNVIQFLLHIHALIVSLLQILPDGDDTRWTFSTFMMRFWIDYNFLYSFISWHMDHHILQKWRIFGTYVSLLWSEKSTSQVYKNISGTPCRQNKDMANVFLSHFNGCFRHLSCLS